MLRIALQHTVLRAPSHAGCVRRCMGIRSIWRCGSPFEGVGTHRKWRSGEAKAPGNHSAHDALSAPLPHIGSKDSEEAHSGADGGDCSQRPGQSGGVVGIAAKSGVIGTIMGTFGGMVGLGGGVIAIPMLTGWCGLSQHQAIGTSLAAIFSTCIAGAATYWFVGDASVDFPAGLTVAGLAMLSANAGAHIGKNMSGIALKRLLGFFMLGTACLMASQVYNMLQESSANTEKDEVEADEGGGCSTDLSTHFWEQFEQHSARDYALYAGFGVITGVVAGMLGVGGGIILLPLLVFGSGLPQQTILGTSLLAMVPTTLVGSVAHYALGNVVTRTLPGLLIGAAVGGYVGGRIAIYLEEYQQKAVVCATMLSLALRTFI